MQFQTVDFCSRWDRVKQFCQGEVDRIKDTMRHGKTDDPYYLNGKRDGFEAIMRCGSSATTVDNLQQGIEYYEAGNGGSMMFRQGIIDSYKLVINIIQQWRSKDRL